LLGNSACTTVSNWKYNLLVALYKVNGCDNAEIFLNKFNVLIWAFFTREVDTEAPFVDSSDEVNLTPVLSEKELLKIR
jgi:hypothetical protein